MADVNEYAYGMTLCASLFFSFSHLTRLAWLILTRSCGYADEEDDDGVNAFSSSSLSHGCALTSGARVDGANGETDDDGDYKQRSIDGVTAPGGMICSGGKGGHYWNKWCEVKRI